jgi:hypothetical protein
MDDWEECGFPWNEMRGRVGCGVICMSHFYQRKLHCMAWAQVTSSITPWSIDYSSVERECVIIKRSSLSLSLSLSPVVSCIVTCAVDETCQVSSSIGSNSHNQALGAHLRICLFPFHLHEKVCKCKRRITKTQIFHHAKL